MAISFPGSKSNGQKFTAGNKSWTWNGASWKGTTSNGGDATSLGGTSATSFLRSDASDSFSGTLTYSGSSIALDTGGDNIDLGTLKIVGSNGVSGWASKPGIHFESPGEFRIHASNGDVQLYVDGEIYADEDKKVFHTGNDGPGSGLDADTVDGIQGSSFLRSDANDTMTGNLTIDSTDAWNAGNGMLNVGGAGDGRIQVRHIWGKSASGAGTDDLWLQYSNASQHVQIGANGGGNNLYVAGSIYAGGYFAGNRVLTQADEGSGNGIDADTVDGIQGSSFLRSDTSDTATQINSPIFSGNISTTGDGQNNYPFRLTSDWNSYMVAVATNTWGLFWAGSSGARYGTNGLGGPGNIWNNVGNPNEFVFVGSDDTAWSVNGNNGNTWQSGTLTTVGDITSGGNITANSDISLKDNIVTIPDALDKLLQIRGVTYNRNDIEDNPRQTGVIAQEVETVLPEVVSEDALGIKSVAYGNMVGLLIEAIKEQQARIDALEERLNANNT